MITPEEVLLARYERALNALMAARHKLWVRLWAINDGSTVESVRLYRRMQGMEVEIYDLRNRISYKGRPLPSGGGGWL